MKYIDSEKLIAEIERRREKCADIAADERNEEVAEYYRGKEVAYDETSSLIASLQQEQPKPTCKTCGFYENNCPFIRGKLIPYPNRVCKDYIHSAMEEQEQPEVDLKKEIEEMWNSRFNLGWDEHSALSMNHEGFVYIARHFYGLRNRALEKAARHVYESWMGGTMDDVRRDMVELGNVLNARKED